MIGLPERHGFFPIGSRRARTDLAPCFPHDLQDIGRDNGASSRDRIGGFDMKSFYFGEHPCSDNPKLLPHVVGKDI